MNALNSKRITLISLVLTIMNLSFGSPPPPFADLERYVGETMQRLAPSSAAIVVSHRDEVIYENYLTGSFEGLPRTKVNQDTLWAIASVTKSFSSGVVLALSSQEVIALDDPVAKYLPEFRSPGEGPFDRSAVTIRHLASHTSGVNWPKDLATKNLDRIEVGTKPGASFYYSATGMYILQQVLEAATGEKFESLVQRLVLDPLGLSNTHYLYKYDADLPLIATYAGDFGDPARHYHFAHPNGLVGSGLYTTARDLNRYAQLWARGGTLGQASLFSPQLRDEAAASQTHFDFLDADYGLLWWAFPAQRAMVMSGATHTVSAISLEHEVAITVMRNFYGEIPAGFVFHADKQMLVDFANDLGASLARP